MGVFRFVVIAASVLTLLRADGPTQETVAPENARYAVVQSTLAARYVFKLDRYTGRVWQLATGEDGSSEWREIEVLGLLPQKVPESPRYQISVSGVGKWKFLLDTVTGKTWMLTDIVSDVKDDGRLPGAAWVPVDTAKSPYPSGPYLPAATRR